MSYKLGQACPGCGDELHPGLLPHCDTERRGSACGWVKHSCGIVIDPKRGIWAWRAR